MSVLVTRGTIPDKVFLDPFGKPLHTLAAPDLELLRDVSEGWYVEYKREPIHARLVGKGLSAFSNHFGGWLIFGIHAPQRVPVGFPGLDLQQSRTVMDSLRDAVRNHVHPLIVFESHEVTGPHAPIGLAADRSIIIARVTQGHNPPYIHSSGRIYRRVDDSSDPKPETDRAVIDLLTERAREHRKRFSRRLKRRPEFSEGEEEMPVLQMFLTTDPWHERDIRHVLQHSEFAKIMSEHDAAFSIPLDCSFPNALGFTARQVAKNDPFNMLYTWNVTLGGFSSVVIPLRTLDSESARHYKYAGDFFAKLPDSLHARVIDATVLWLFVANAIAKQDALAKAMGIEGALFVKLRFLNVWRRVPYVDTQIFIDQVRNHGIPLLQQSEQLAPPGTDPDDMLELKPWIGEAKEPSMIPLIRAAEVLYWLLGAIGVPHAAMSDSTALKEITEIFARAIRVHGSPVTVS